VTPIAVDAPQLPSPSPAPLPSYGARLKGHQMRILVADRLPERFVKAMEDRMADLAPDTRDAYFVILTKLVDKLETPEKPLKDIMQEMMAEAMTEVLHIIQA